MLHSQGPIAKQIVPLFIVLLVSFRMRLALVFIQ